MAANKGGPSTVWAVGARPATAPAPRVLLHACAAAPAPAEAAPPPPARPETLRFAIVTEDPGARLTDPPISRTMRLSVWRDGSVAIHEGHKDNTGRPGGTFLSRTRTDVHLVKPATAAAKFPDGVMIGCGLVIVGREWRVADADGPTREYFLKALASPLAAPSSAEVPAAAAPPAHRRPGTSAGGGGAPPLKQFLENDGRVLRFNARWADQENLLGDTRSLVLAYYLADDSIAVTDGRGGGRVLARQRVPRSGLEARPPLPGYAPAPPLRAAGAASALHHPITGAPTYDDGDAGRRPGAAVPPFLCAGDLVVGCDVHLFGRGLTLLDADAYTRAWFAEVLDFEQPGVAPAPPPLPPAPREPPPHAGTLAFGGEEDSLGSCGPRVLPARRRGVDDRDFTANAGKVLRFAARLAAPSEAFDAAREFIISYFLADGTLAVYEGGAGSGKFLDRGKHRNARRAAAAADAAAPAAAGDDFRVGRAVSSAPPAPYFTAADLVVGGLLEFAHAPGQAFVLTSADAFTQRYLAGGSGSGGSAPPAVAAAAAAPAAAAGSDGAAAATVLAHALHARTASLLAALAGGDRARTGRAPAGVVAGEVARLAGGPSRVDASTVAALLAAHADEGGVRYEELVHAIEHADAVVENKIDAAFNALRAALISSRAHFRKALLDIDVSQTGVVTLSELHSLLHRHNLDSGLSPAEVGAVLARFAAPSRGVTGTAAAASTVPTDKFLGALVAGAGPGCADLLAELKELQAARASRVAALRCEAAATAGRAATPPPPAAAAPPPLPPAGDATAAAAARLQAALLPVAGSLSRVFRLYDTQNHGSVDERAVKGALGSLGVALAPADLAALMDTFGDTATHGTKRVRTLRYGRLVEALVHSK